jgi:hypothetical protein
MKTSRKLLPLVAVSLFLLAATPAAFASTLRVTINPTTRTADLVSTSATTLVLTYPSNSSLSEALRNYSSTVNWSGSFNGVSAGALALQGSFDHEDSRIRVQNLNVSYSLVGKGNDTTLVINKETNVSATVTGVFRVVNGTVHIDLGWRAFDIVGPLELYLGGHEVDVNEVGTAFNLQLGDHPLAMGAVDGMFAGYGLWHSSTLNFSALDTPLSTWTRNYDASTNTTTYSKTIGGSSSESVSLDVNGQKYTMSTKSDPSAQIVVQGYAVASGDSLVVQQAPTFSAWTTWVAIATVIVVAAGGAAYMLRRAKARAQPRVPSATAAVQ